jgi:hypothetical protein
MPKRWVALYFAGTFSACVFISSTAAMAQPAPPCAKDTLPPPGTGIPILETPHNTLVFNHYALSAAVKGPHVLAVRDGGYFQIRFICTDPTKFNYRITANTDEQQKVAGQNVTGERIDTKDLSSPASVTMRHSKLFTRYRVEISLRDDLKSAPLAVSGRSQEAGGGNAPAQKHQEEAFTLYSTYFDLWVETLPEWTVDFSGGIAFTGLRSREYFVKTDTKNTDDADDDVKTVEEDAGARASFRPDIIALANVRHPRMRGLGAVFGVGLNNDADPRYFLGVSYLLGGKFIFNAGWAGGKVNELPVGQELHKAPINGDNTLTTPSARFRQAFYFGLGFTFINREDEFKGAFAAAQKTSDDEAPRKENVDESKASVATSADLVGSYTRGSETITVERQGEGLAIKLNAKATPDLLIPDGGLKYHIGEDKARKDVTFIQDTSKKIAAVEVMSGDKGATYKKEEGPPK